MKKRFVALLMTAAMLAGTLSGCGSNGGEGSDTPASGGAESQSQAGGSQGQANAGDSQATGDDASLIPEWLNPGSMPIVSEGTEKTLRIATILGANAGEPEDTWFYKYIEEPVGKTQNKSRGMCMKAEVIAADHEGYMTKYSNGSWRIGMITPAERFEHITYLERHNETDEIFILLKGKAVLLCEDEGALCTTELESGKLYVVPKACWHNIRMYENSVAAVVENADTSGENTDYMDYVVAL